MNGVDLGVILHSRFSANAIMKTISRVLCDDLCSFICSHSVKIAVLLDESTTVSHKSTMIVSELSLRLSPLSFPSGQDDSAIIFQLELVELDSLDAQTMTLAVLARFQGVYSLVFLPLHNMIGMSPRLHFVFYIKSQSQFRI